MPVSEDGDPPCWSHLFDDARADIVDRDDIDLLVRNFYRDAAMDDLLGPVFEAARVNWNSHVATLIDFWSVERSGDGVEQRGSRVVPTRRSTRSMRSA